MNEYHSVTVYWSTYYDHEVNDTELRPYLYILSISVLCPSRICRGKGTFPRRPYCFCGRLAYMYPLYEFSVFSLPDVSQALRRSTRSIITSSIGAAILGQADPFCMGGGEPLGISHTFSRFEIYQHVWNICITGGTFRYR